MKSSIFFSVLVVVGLNLFWGIFVGEASEVAFSGRKALAVLPVAGKVGRRFM